MLHDNDNMVYTTCHSDGDQEMNGVGDQQLTFNAQHASNTVPSELNN